MIGITVFSDRKIIFSALKLFEKVLHIGQIIEAFQWHVMTQIDNKIELTNQANYMTLWCIW